MANSIFFWNDVAMDANKQAHTDGLDRGAFGPTLSSRAFAIVHLAMYDAYAAVRRVAGANLPEYLPGLPPPPAGAVALDAAAGAAFAALVALYPSQRSRFENEKVAAGIAPGTPPAGFAYGERIAKVLLAERLLDPGAQDTGYNFNSGRGRHRVDPDNPKQGFHAPFYGAQSSGFAITNRHGLLAPPQPSAGDKEYLEALKEVRCKGIKPELMGTLPDRSDKRNADETVIGLFWGYDGAAELGTPPRLYNQIVQKIAKSQPGGDDEHARLLALVNAAMGDAGILAWDQKYLHDLWRPVVGIREHDPSFGPEQGGPVTNNLDPDADPGWLPLGAPASNRMGQKNFTPNFPAYPSGHATFGAAALEMTRLFYKSSDDKKHNLVAGLTFVSEEFDGKTFDNTGTIRPRHERRFDSIRHMILENGQSRIFLGVHWIFDAYAVKKNGDPDLSRNVGGVPLGLAIAKDIFDSKLKPSPVGPR